MSRWLMALLVGGILAGFSGCGGESDAANVAQPADVSPGLDTLSKDGVGAQDTAQGAPSDVGEPLPDAPMVADASPSATDTQSPMDAPDGQVSPGQDAAHTDAGGQDAAGTDAVDAPEPDVPGQDIAVGPSPNPPVESWGPHKVGTRVYSWVDTTRGRAVSTRLWYPVSESGGDKATYLDLILTKVQGQAIHKGSATGGPWPVVLFSHGFKGINWQSYSFAEYVASHGYVVAAPDHVGNTLFDFSADKATESKSALERPKDLAFAWSELVTLNAKTGTDMYQRMDLDHVAVTGHSFGGYTAIVAAGGEVDVNAAKKGCATASNMLCKGGYMDAWPDGATIKLDKPIAGVKAMICLAPGFDVAFGKPGMSKVKVPGLLFGGTLDDTTPIATDINPMYANLPSPKAKVLITGASHMSFTNICSLPPAQAVPQLKEMCVKPGLIDLDKGFELTNAFAVAWLNRWLKGDLAMAAALSKLATSNPAAVYTSEGL